VGKATLVALGTVVFVVQFAADFLGGFGLDDLPLDGVRKKAVETVFAVAHIEVNAGVVATINMCFSALGRHIESLSSCAFTHCEELVGAKSLDTLQLVF
jgi:hypothetical protein